MTARNALEVMHAKWVEAGMPGAEDQLPLFSPVRYRRREVIEGERLDRPKRKRR